MIFTTVFCKMRTWLAVSALVLLQMAASAQVSYFAYLQSDDLKPFTVTLNKKLYNSSPVGHLILPALAPGTYDIAVALAGEAGRQDYRLTIKEDDGGYLIKKFDNKYGLLNLINSEIQMSGAAKQADIEAKAEAARLAKEAAEQEERTRQAQLSAEKEAAERANREKAEREAVLLRQQQEAEAETRRQQQAAAAKAEKAAQEASMNDEEKKAAAEKALKQQQEEEVRRYNEERRKQLEAEAAAAAAATQAANEKTATSTTPPQATTQPKSTDRPLTPAEIAQLQEEARKIDARGKRDSVLKAQSQSAPSNNGQPKFLDMDFTMDNEEKAAEPVKKDSTPVAPVPASTEQAAAPVRTATPDTAQAQPLSKPEIAIDTAQAQPIIKAEAPADTAVASQPVPPVPAKPQVQETPIQTSSPTSTTPVPDKVPAKEANRQATDTATATANNPAAPAAASTNTNCAAAATNEEVELIALLIKAEKNTDDALDVVRKFVRLKCVSNRQVRSMAAHFADQEGKYRLLDMCYRYSNEQPQYAALANLLTDTYYLNRFKAMLQ